MLLRLSHIQFYLPIFLTCFLLASCGGTKTVQQEITSLQIIEDPSSESFSIVRSGTQELILTQNAKTGMRPYLHPIMAPDGNGALTQFSPGHHKHQTGLYWGFTRVNGTGAPVDTLRRWFYDRNKPQHIKEMIGRDFFHFNGETHWKKISASIVKAEGEQVQWQTIYHMLDAEGNPILEETKNWAVREQGGKFLIELEWNGKALEDITINEFPYGGMFLRMPWKKDIAGEAVNSAGQKNQEAEGQKATWVDVGMAIDGLEDWGHIAILDHPENGDHPVPWRVDGQLGIGPCRAIGGDWQIPKGQTEIIRHQLVVYTGELNAVEMEGLWKSYAGK